MNPGELEKPAIAKFQEKTMEKIKLDNIHILKNLVIEVTSLTFSKLISASFNSFHSEFISMKKLFVDYFTAFSNLTRDSDIAFLPYAV